MSASSITSRERVLELSKKLEKAKSKSDATKVLQILQLLSSIQINIALLRESGLGKKVNSIKKSQSFKNSRNIIESATTLIAAWRAMASKEKEKLKQQKKLKSKKKESSAHTTVKQSNDANNEHSNNEKQASVDTEDTDNGFVREPSVWKTGDERRDKMIEKFIKVLRPKVDKSEYLCYYKVSAQIEQSLRDAYDQKPQELFRKMRDLHFNLKKNKQLCDDLLFGVVTSDKFVQMTNDDMAVQAKKEQRDKDNEWRLKEARSDHCLDESQCMTDEFKCGKCKQRKTKYSQAQTRSADEPMTTFVTCLVCGNRWRF